MQEHGSAILAIASIPLSSGDWCFYVRYDMQHYADMLTVAIKNSTDNAIGAVWGVAQKAFTGNRTGTSMSTLIRSKRLSGSLR
ncbi:MAG: hypothetical protein ACPLTR_05195 [Thermacetogeniaceae bacterium]